MAAYAFSSSRSPSTTNGTCTSPVTAAGWRATTRPRSGPAGMSRSGGHAVMATGLTVVSFGNGRRMSRRAASRLAADGIGCRVLDLRWLAPLPAADVLREARVTGRVLVADETRRTGGGSEAIITALVEADFSGRIARVASEDSFIPLGDAAATVLLSEQDIETAARELLR